MTMDARAVNLDVGVPEPPGLPSRHPGAHTYMSEGPWVGIRILSRRLHDVEWGYLGLLRIFESRSIALRSSPPAGPRSRPEDLNPRFETPTGTNVSRKYQLNGVGSLGTFIGSPKGETRTWNGQILRPQSDARPVFGADGLFSPRLVPLWSITRRPIV